MSPKPSSIKHRVRVVAAREGSPHDHTSLFSVCFRLFTLPSVIRLPPRQAESRVDGIVISLDSSDKALELRNAASDGFLHPSTQLVVFTLTHHREKGLQQGMDSLYLRREVQELIEPCLVSPFRDRHACARAASVTHAARRLPHAPCASEAQSHLLWSCAGERCKPAPSWHCLDIPARLSSRYSWAAFRSPWLHRASR